MLTWCAWTGNLNECTLKDFWFSVNWVCEGQHPARGGSALRVKEGAESHDIFQDEDLVSFFMSWKIPRKNLPQIKKQKSPKKPYTQASRKIIHFVMQQFDLMHFTMLQCIFKQFNCSYVLFLMLKSILHRYPSFCFTPFLTRHFLKRAVWIC